MALANPTGLWIIVGPHLREAKMFARNKRLVSYRAANGEVFCNDVPPLPDHHVVAFCKIHPGEEHVTPLTKLTQEVKIQLALMEDPADPVTVRIQEFAVADQPMNACAESQ